jgi:hypothetical protein
MKMLMIAMLAAMGACAASASPTALAGGSEEPALDTPLAAASELSCDVRAIRTSRGVRFEATALSASGAAGEYEFVITKRDRGGASDIVQGGEYDLIAGDEQSLGGAEISVERGGAYSAQLLLRDADGVACSAEASR